MKHVWKLFFLLLCLSVPKAHAQLAVADGVVQGLMTKMGIDQAIHFGQMIANQIENVTQTAAQIEMMVEAEKRALNNLKGIADVKNFDDFMAWQNRQLYMEREAEERFMNLGVKIGGKNYTVTELDGIPGALRNTFGDPYWDDFSEEQRSEMYHQLGLTPSNYNYVKLWSAREDYWMKKALTDPERINDEAKRSSEDNLNWIGKYRQENKNLDSNEILKNMHITQMKTEMVLRDISAFLAEKERHELELRKLGQTPPNKPHFSEHWNDDLFGKLSDEDWQTSK